MHARLEARVPPFARLPLGEQVLLAVGIAAGEMGSRVNAILAGKDPILTQPRYHALRMLSGAGPDGLSCGDIAERLLLSAPDVTRMMDPLVRRGVVSRAPDPDDRRVVRQRITKTGRAWLRDVEGRLHALYGQVVEGLGTRWARGLVNACERFIEVAHTLDDQAAPRTARRAG